MCFVVYGLFAVIGNTFFCWDLNEDEECEPGMILYSFGNEVAFVFWALHFTFYQLYQRGHEVMAFQVYLKYSNLLAWLTILVYLNYDFYSSVTESVAAAFGLVYFLLAYKWYWRLWRNVFTFVEAQVIQEKLREYSTEADVQAD